MMQLNSEIFARFLFSLIALKDIFATLKNRVSISVNDSDFEARVLFPQTKTLAKVSDCIV